MHRRFGDPTVPSDLLRLARLGQRIINDQPPLPVQGARISSHSDLHFFQCKMGCCTRHSCHIFPLLTLRSEEHTSELQSRQYLVCRLLLEKKKRRTSARTTANTWSKRIVMRAISESLGLNCRGLLVMLSTANVASHSNVPLKNLNLCHLRL